MYAEDPSIIPLAKDRYDKLKDTPQKVFSTQIKGLLMTYWGTSAPKTGAYENSETLPYLIVLRIHKYC